MVVTCISLVTSDVEHPFMWLLIICISSWEKCVFKSFVQLIVYSLLSIDALYIFWILNFYQIDMYILQIFLSFCKISFMCWSWVPVTLLNLSIISSSFLVYYFGFSKHLKLCYLWIKSFTSFLIWCCLFLFLLSLFWL